MKPIRPGGQDHRDLRAIRTLPWAPARFLVVAVLATACGGPDSPAPGAARATSEAPGAGALFISPGTLPGDTIGPFRVSTVELKPVQGEDNAWVGEVRFTGIARLSGTRRPHPSDPELEAVCFFPDSVSALELPRLARDERVSWFCFSNPEAAEELVQDQPETITIEDYRYLFSYSDVFNTARLVSVGGSREPQYAPGHDSNGPEPGHGERR